MSGYPCQSNMHVLAFSVLLYISGMNIFRISAFFPILEFFPHFFFYFFLFYKISTIDITGTLNTEQYVLTS